MIDLYWDFDAFDHLVSEYGVIDEHDAVEIIRNNPLLTARLLYKLVNELNSLSDRIGALEFPQ